MLEIEFREEYITHNDTIKILNHWSIIHNNINDVYTIIKKRSTPIYGHITIKNNSMTVVLLVPRNNNCIVKIPVDGIWLNPEFWSHNIVEKYPVDTLMNGIFEINNMYHTMMLCRIS